MYPESNKRIQNLIASGNQAIIDYAFSQNERYLAIGLADNSIDLYEKDARKWEKKPIVQPSIRVPNNNISQLVFSEDESVLIIIAGTFLYFQPLNDQINYPKYFEHHCGEILNVAFKNELLIVVGKQQTLFAKNEGGIFSGIGCHEVTYNNSKTCIFSEKSYMMTTENNVYVTLYPKEGNTIAVTQTILPTANKTLIYSAFSPCEKYIFLVLKNNKIEILKNNGDRWDNVGESCYRQTPQKILTTTVSVEDKEFLLIFDHKGALKAISINEPIKKFIITIDFFNYSFSPDNTQCFFYADRGSKIFFADIQNVKNNMIYIRNSTIENEISATFHNFRDYDIAFSTNGNYLTFKSKFIINQLKMISLEETPLNMSVMESPARSQGTFKSSYHNFINQTCFSRCSTISFNKQYLANIFTHYAEIRRFSDNVIVKLYDFENASQCIFSLDGHYFAAGFSGKPAKIKIIKINFENPNMEITEVSLESNPEFLAFSKDNNKLFIFQTNGAMVQHSITGNLYGRPNLKVPKKLAYLYINNRLLTYHNDIINFIDVSQNRSTIYPLIIEDMPLQTASPMLLPPSLDDRGLSMTMTPRKPIKRSLFSTSSINSQISTLSNPANNTKSSQELACFSPDGAYLARQRNNKTEIFDVQSQRRVQYIDTPHATYYEFSPNSNYLAIVSNTMLFIYDITFGRCIQTIKENYRIGFCKFSPDMRSIFLGVDVTGLVSHRLTTENVEFAISSLKKIVSLRHNENSILFKQFFKDSIERSLVTKLFVNKINVSHAFSKVIRIIDIPVQEIKNQTSEKITTCTNTLLEVVQKTIRNRSHASFISAFIFSILHQCYIDALTASLGKATLLVEVPPYYNIKRYKAEFEITTNENKDTIVFLQITSEVSDPVLEFNAFFDNANPLTYNHKIILSLKYLLTKEAINILGLPILTFSENTPNDTKSTIIKSIESEPLQGYLTNTLASEDLAPQQFNNINKISQKIINDTLCAKDFESC